MTSTNSTDREQDEEAEMEAEFQRMMVKDGPQPQTTAASKQNRQRKTDAFVKVPLWWIEIAAKATRSPTTIVLIELLYAAWKAQSLTFPLPNARLKKLGVSREIKRRVLRDLELRRLILVERRPRKTPIITLIAL